MCILLILVDFYAALGHPMDLLSSRVLDHPIHILGSQDDLVSLFSFRGRIVARCQGHASWVQAVSFDAHRCTDRIYRFMSVGDDTRLCQWEFSSSTLHSRSNTLRDLRKEESSEPIIHERKSKTEVPFLEPIFVRFFACAFMMTETINER